MASLKSLVKDTAIYGLSSIVGRFLNYLLVIVHTDAMPRSSGEYGIMTNIYSYVALLFVILTYGMETTFFRFINKEGQNPQNVYRTVLTMVGTTSTLFVLLVFLFLNPISTWMGYADRPIYVGVMAIVIALDAFQAILFAYLRYQKKAIKFASLKLLFIGFSIALNLLFYLAMKKTTAGYAFYANIMCTSAITFFMWKELRDGFKGKFDKSMVKSMLSYAWPILVLGVAGILNQAADKMFFLKIYPGSDAKVQLGIYGACVKIAMIMAMITQAFRYAYEPFVFAGSKDKDQKVMYSEAMKYFILFTLLAFLMVMGYMDLLKEFLIKDEGYWEGLKVVPIVMIAEIMMGISFNLSIWYKLTDKTIWGAIISIIGCVVLLAVNIIFVPQYSYMACAWGAVAGYGICMVLSYFLGQKYFPINYQLKTVFLYVILAVAGYYTIEFINDNFTLLPKLALNTVVVGIFAGACVLQMKRKR